MNVYMRYMNAEIRAWFEGDTAKAIVLARWKARAYKMYAVTSLYY